MRVRRHDDGVAFRAVAHVDLLGHALEDRRQRFVDRVETHRARSAWDGCRCSASVSRASAKQQFLHRHLVHHDAVGLRRCRRPGRRQNGVITHRRRESPCPAPLSPVAYRCGLPRRRNEGRNWVQPASVAASSSASCSCPGAAPRRRTAELPDSRYRSHRLYPPVPTFIRLALRIRVSLLLLRHSRAA